MTGSQVTMEVHFQVEYWTTWGQNLVLVGSSDALGKWDATRSRQMVCHHEGDSTLVWALSVSIPAPCRIDYYYAVVDEDGKLVKKENVTRKLVLATAGNKAVVKDTWQDRNSPAVVVATPSFRKAIGMNRESICGVVPRQIHVPGHIIFRFIVRDWLCEDGQTLHITGGIPQIGNWQQEESYALTETDLPVWEGEVLVPVNAFPFTYKFAVVDKTGFVLEKGESRLASLPLCAAGEHEPSLVVAEGGHFRHDHYWRGAGIALPIFSLRTRMSVGTGEFRDMRILIDFCEAVQFQLIQVLPVNDTSVHKMWWDSYPYSSLSVFALHPLYLCLEALSDNIPDYIQEQICSARLDLGEGDMDYEKTMLVKLTLAKEMFDLEGASTLKSSNFNQFFEENKTWLKPYAVFCFLRDLFGTAEHWKWGELKSPTNDTIDRISDPSQEFHASIQFIYYLQYHLHEQLIDIRNYAEGKGVALKGDLPIGVDKCSVDTWMAPTQFRMNKSTGAPPDYFDPKGQNWGFPTYNWEEMSKDGYSWWRQRLGKLSGYFHAYRIDHILGFFRIWEIPDDCNQASLGCFRPTYPLARSELECLGMWDFDRLCEPYILMSHLEEVFGDLAENVCSKFFCAGPGDLLRFREEYHSEVCILNIKPSESSAWMENNVTSIKEGLLKLFQNVVLIHHPTDKDAFFPRFRLADTNSFLLLNEPWKEILTKLHDDYYYHKHNDYWRNHALQTLPVLIESSDMLVCGEDLGMIPSCVHPVMQELGLLGLRLQRMPSEQGRAFGDISAYPYLTVCSPSCHDVLTTRAWWQEDEARRGEYYQEILNGKGEAPNKCTPAISKAIIEEHMASPSVLTIIPIQDLFALSDLYNTRSALEETINKPTKARHYWRYRMHVNVEDLMDNSEFQADIIALMRKTHRGAKYWRSTQVRQKTQNGFSHSEFRLCAK